MSIIYVSIYLNNIVRIVRFSEFEIEKIHVCNFEIIFQKSVQNQNIYFYNSILNKNNKY